MKKTEKSPPSFLNSLLKVIYGKDRYREVSGDLHELFNSRYKEKGRAYALFFYVKDAILSLRNMRLKRTSQNRSTGLFYHHWLIATRMVKRNPIYVALNIIGLSVGIASFLIIHAHISFEESYDLFHSKHEQIYRIDYKLSHQNELLSHTATTPPMIAPFIKDNVPGVKAFVRVLKYPGLVVRYGEAIFREDQVLMVDPSFFDVFDFQVLEGDNKTALKDRGAMMISRNTKMKFFGDEDAIGKAISIDGYKDYFITGVFENPPVNSHLQFEILISFETARWWFEGETDTDWTSRNYYSYLLLEDKTDAHSVVSLLENINLQTPQGRIDQENDVVRNYGLTALEDIHLYSSIEEEIDQSDKGSLLFVQFLSIISYVILLISWFNYINQLTTRSFTRSKEVGLRKVIGASKKNLMAQFFVESSMVHLIGFLAGIGLLLLAAYVFPVLGVFYFNLESLILSNAPAQILGFLLLGFIFSSLLPSFYLASINPLNGLMGTFKTGKKGQLIRKVLVTIQLSASAILITSTIVIFLQLKHISSQKLGFDIEKTLVINGPSTSQANSTAFFTQLERNTNIRKVVATELIPGTIDIEKVPIARKDKPDAIFDGINTFSVGHHYLSTLGIKFLAGRDFDPGFPTDTAAIIINQSALNKMGWHNPAQALNTPMKFGSGYEVKIIGVIEDYLQTSAKSKSLPLVIWLYPDESVHYVIKYSGDDELVKKQAKKVYSALYPEDPFEYYYLEDFYHEQFKADEQFSYAFVLFTIIAIVLTSLGLFSAVYWSLSSKKKEVGIRKILGATVGQIAYFISSEFLRIIVIAYLISIPITYLLMGTWLVNYATRITLNASIYLTSLVSMLLIIILTVGYRTYQSAILNPVDVLHDE